MPATLGGGPENQARAGRTAVFQTIRRIFGLGTGNAAAEQLYAIVVAQARQPAFYTHLRVPDSVDGRFDLIALHLFLLLDRFPPEERNHPLLQAVLEEFFVDMDRSLREIGVGDMSLKKKIHRMIDALYGRLERYREILETPGREGELPGALLRNVWRRETLENPGEGSGVGYGEGGTLQAADALAQYVLRARLDLGQKETAAILGGDLAFPAPETVPAIGALDPAADGDRPS